METGTVLNELSIVTAVASPFTVAFAMFPKASFWKVLVAEGVVEDVRIPKFCWVFPDWVISRVVSVAAPISVIPVAGQGCRLRPGRHRGGNKPVSVVRGIVRIPAAAVGAGEPGVSISPTRGRAAPVGERNRRRVTVTILHLRFHFRNRIRLLVVQVRGRAGDVGIIAGTVGIPAVRYVIQAWAGSGGSFLVR